MKTITVIVLLCTTLFFSVSAAPNEHVTANDKNKKELNGQEIKSINENKSTDHMITGVIGGKRASINDYPYIAAVLANAYHRGSGIILNNKWVLTSTWVSRKVNASLILIRGGSNSAIDKGQTSWAEKFVTHPDYEYPYYYDIALIKLKTPFKFDKKVKPIKIANKSPVKGESVVLSGFGYSDGTEEKKGNSNDFIHDGWLRSLNRTVIDYQGCKHYYDSYPTFTELNYCTPVTDFKGPCLCESGSPLVRNKELVGVLSIVFYCPDPSYPSVYTDITQKKLKDWIEETIKKNSDASELEEFSNTEYYA
ncbi:trypsin-7-like isoform X1 [Lycorma delicatula]|uniref:trypsin-7-like isoform X1 n=1 Tax=Lycorma delicatula TaxID=130591 RepID=UPI003F5154A0